MKQYTHQLRTGKIDEVEHIITAFESIDGWKFIKLLPEENVLPTHIVFEWTKNCPMHFPLL
ncbi:MAG TPA: hypothetical protein DCM73_12445 [Clostridiales bacterium]|nr:hypothetical protein [Clostridiales bacterium]